MSAKRRLVMAFGSFDLIHPGHIRYLEHSRSYGERLLVVVARDESIKRFKGRKPVLGEQARLEVVRALRAVDGAVLGNKLSSARDMYRIIKKNSPDVLVFGYDQKVDIAGIRRYIANCKFKTRIVRLRVAQRPDIFKSSIMKRGLL